MLNIKNIFKSSTIFFLTLVVGFSFFVSFANASITPGTELEGYAWGADDTNSSPVPGGLGWVSFNCSNHDLFDPCAVPYSVSFTQNMVPTVLDLTGYAWSSNYGWIKFGGFTGPFPNGSGTIPVSARFNTTNNEFSGWFRFCGAMPSPSNCSGGNGPGQNSGNWDGWVSMSGNVTGGGTYKVSLSPSGHLAGYAWGGEVVGWIDMSGVKIISTGKLRLWAGTNGFPAHPANPLYTETFNTNPTPPSSDPATIVVYANGTVDPICGGPCQTKVSMKWEISGMQSCAISQSANAPTWIEGPVPNSPANGNWLISITENNSTLSTIRKTYTLTCIPVGGGSTMVRTAIVDILPAIGPVVDLSADPGLINNIGDMSVLSWYGVNIDTSTPCTASTVGNPTAPDWDINTNPTSTATPSNLATKVVYPPLSIPSPLSITYKITCNVPVAFGGGTVSDTAVVSMAENANLNLVANPSTNISVGGTTTLSWSYINTTTPLGHCVPKAIPPLPLLPNADGGVTNWDDKNPIPSTTAGFGINGNPLPATGSVSTVAVPGNAGETTTYWLDCVTMSGAVPKSSNYATATLKTLNNNDILGFYISSTSSPVSSTGITVAQGESVQLDWDGGSASYDWYNGGLGSCTASDGNFATNGTTNWSTYNLLSAKKIPGYNVPPPAKFNFAENNIKYPNAPSSGQYTINCNDGAGTTASKTVTITVVDNTNTPTIWLQTSTNSVLFTNPFVDIVWSETSNPKVDLTSCIGVARNSTTPSSTNPLVSNTTIANWSTTITSLTSVNGYFAGLTNINVPAPITNYTLYQVRCTDPSGNFIYSNIEPVRVDAPLSNLSVDIKVSDMLGNYQDTPPFTPHATLPLGGGNAYLFWTSTDAIACYALASNPGSLWKGPGPWSANPKAIGIGNEGPIPITVSTGFAIRCEDTSGNQVDDYVVIRVTGTDDPPPLNGLKKPSIKEF